MFTLYPSRSFPLLKIALVAVLAFSISAPVYASDAGVIAATMHKMSQVLEMMKQVLQFEDLPSGEKLLAATATTSNVSVYQLIKSTYLDGDIVTSRAGGMTRDVAFDPAGNMYVTGGTMAPDFPTTVGAYDRSYATGGNSLGRLGTMDVFVMKFNPQGVLLWSTLLGGPNYDRTYALEVGPQGEVVVAGRAGEGFPTTAGVIQPTFLNNSSDAARFNTEYGRQNGFVTKFDSNGNLQWSSYFSAGIIRDMDIDSSGNIHLVPTESPMAFPHITRNAYQSVLRGSNDGMYAKISPDGRQLLYGTYIGGSGKDGMHPTVKVTEAGDVYYSTWTQSGDFPLKNAFQTTRNGSSDAVIAKFAADGTLIFSSYYGGNGIEQMETHSLAIDSQNNAYLSGDTNSTDLRIVGGAHTTASGPGDVFVIKVSPLGQLLASTYIGGNGLDRLEGIVFNNVTQELIVTGNTRSTNFATPGSYKTTLSGAQDGAVTIISSDLSRITYASYFGGAGTDEIRAVDVRENTGAIIIGGMTNSQDLPLVGFLDNTLNTSMAPFFAVIAAGSSTTALPTVPTPVIDTDRDGVPDTTDNCSVFPNPNQENFDNDSWGNVCDADDDNDSIVDASELIGCVFDASPLCGRVTSTPTAAPTLTFTAANTNLLIGDKGYFTWSSTNATTCLASGSWKGDRTTSGNFTTVSRSVVGTSFFTLTCTGPGGSVSKSVSLTATVAPAPTTTSPLPVVTVPTTTPIVAPTLTFTAANTNLLIGDKGYFTWSSTNATTCLASGSWKGDRTTSGNFTTVNRSVLGTDTFTLTCTGRGGSVSKSVSLTATAR